MLAFRLRLKSDDRMAGSSVAVIFG